MKEGLRPQDLCGACEARDIEQSIPGDGSPADVVAWIVVRPEPEGWSWHDSDPQHPDESVAVYRRVWCPDCKLSFKQITLRA